MPLQPPENIRSILPYEPGKPVEEVERELGLTDSIKVASNENPLGPSPRAVSAMQAALKDLNRYPDASGFYLRRALAERHGVDPGQVVLGNGSTELVEILARTYLGVEDNAVISEQAFIMYRIAVMQVNGNARMVPMKDYTHDLRAMADAVDQHTRLIYIANPNNPTGTCVGSAEMDHLLERVPEGTLAVIDEAYHEYVEGHADYPDTLAHLRRGGRLVILRTFSKIYGLAGLRIGYALAPAKVVSHMQRVRSPFNTSALAHRAALAALDDQEHVDRCRRMNREGLAFLEKALTDLGFKVVPSMANFVLVEVPLGAREAFQRLLRRGIIVRPMDAYGFPHGLRVSVGTPEENRRLVEVFQSGLE